VCPGLKMGVASWLLVVLAGVAAAAGSERVDSMGAIADDFVRLGLLFQNHDPTPYLYIGPEALRTEARSQSVPLDTIVAQLQDLQSRIDELPAAAVPDDQRRRRDLTDRITALAARGRILMAEYPAGFDEETRLIFGVQVPAYDEAHFRAIAAQLDEIIPGEGDLVARVAAFREQFVIPPERLEAVIGRAMEECRARTRAHMALPDDERVTLNITSGKHWVGFTEYRGGGRSIVHLNRDVPVHIERAIELGCHEGYPGHHVHATLVEQELLMRRGWTEYSLITLLGPLAVVAEGAASFAMDLAFSREERIEFERSVLLPLAGLKVEQLDTYYHFIDLLDELNFARNEVARKYLYGGMPREQAVRWLMEFGLETRGTAEQRLNFIDAQRAYVVTYNYGKKLVREYVLSRARPGSDDAWQTFYEVLATPLMPADLVAGSSTMKEYKLAGGWSRQDEPSDDARAALDWVLGQMNTAAHLRRIREVRTQVVAGLNYAIEFELDNGEVWHTIVFRDLGGKFHLSQRAQLGALPDPYARRD